MKIIFDSEEQKNAIIKVLSKDDGCPSKYGMNVVGHCDDYSNCMECWGNAIECEVVGRINVE